MSKTTQENVSYLPTGKERRKTDFSREEDSRVSKENELREHLKEVNELLGEAQLHRTQMHMLKDLHSRIDFYLDEISRE